MQTVMGPFGTLRMETEVVEIKSFGPRTNRAWRYIDAQNHGHIWNGGYPTLQWVVDETYYCEDCHEDHENGHYECPICREHISPGLISGPTYERIPVGRYYYLNDEPITEEEANELIAREWYNGA